MLQSLRKKVLGEYLAASLLILIVGLLFLWGYLKNEGRFFFVFDDPYIHLAFAERLRDGIVVINPDDFSVPSSSLLWPWLLLPGVILGKWLGTTSSLPVLWLLLPNGAVSIGAVQIAYLLIRSAFQDVDEANEPIWALNIVSPRLRHYLAAGIAVLAFALIPLAAVGMEHGLQCWLYLLVLQEIYRASHHESLRQRIWIFAVAAALCRYEGVALLFALILSQGRKYPRNAILSLLFASALLAGASWWMFKNGGEFLPNSVLVKMVEGGLQEENYFERRFKIIIQAFTGPVLLATVPLFLLLPWFQIHRGKGNGLWVFLTTLLMAQILVGPFGWFDRYEAASFMTIVLGTLLLYAQLSPSKYRLIMGVLVLAQLGTGVAGYIVRDLVIPTAMQDIGSQQGEMHRFVRDFYRGPVAVNDLGLISFDNKRKVVDLYGLGSTEALRARRGSKTSEWIDVLCKKESVKMLMIFPQWFPPLGEITWVELGRLRVEHPRAVTPYSEVAFYYRQEASSSAVCAAIKEWQKGLVADATFEIGPKSPCRPADLE